MHNSLCVMLRIACQWVIFLSAVAGAGRVCQAGPDVNLYDVDFNGPPHVVGMTPAFGFGPYPRNTPTSGGQILAPTGTATVVPAFGLLGTRPVEITALDGTPGESILGGANLLFDLSDPALSPLKRFHAQVDVLLGGISTATGLGIFFDAPSIHKVEFSPDGNIRVLDATGLNQIVGTHMVENLYTVGMTFDKEAATWSAAINGTPVYSGPVDDIDLENFRIAMTTGSTTVTSVAAVDNIIIVADAVVVPEPGTLALGAIVTCAGSLLALRRRSSGGHRIW
jgi:hypothetical protein